MNNVSYGLYLNVNPTSNLLLLCSLVVLHFDQTSHKDIDHGSSRKARHSRKSESLPKSDGTVASLRPTQALTVRENFVVEEVARLMAAKRADCVLVIDSEEHLSGIFTAKDLAFKVVGDGMDAKTTTVAQIMTREPKCVKSDTLATDALDTMVGRGFRHLVSDTKS